MSTFLNNELILVKCAHRFMIFEAEHGEFIDQVEFQDMRDEREAQLIAAEKKSFV